MDEMLTVREVQQMLRLSKNVVYNLVNQPDFPSVRIGRKILIPVGKLKEWIDKGGTKKVKG